MIRIVSGIDPQKGGYNPKIWSDHKGVENFMSEIIGSGKIETEDASAYSIHFFDKYFVFSNNKIVRDLKGEHRIGTVSFSVALEDNKDNNDDELNIVDELNNLEKKYKEDELDFSKREDRKPNADISGENTLSDKKSVSLYYKDDEELKVYFRINKDYKKYERIFFINEIYNGQKNNPLRSIQYDEEISFDELLKPDDSKDRKPEGIKEITFMKVIKNPIVTLFAGVLIGITGFWTYQNFIFGTGGNNHNRPLQAENSEDLIAKRDSIIDIVNNSIKQFNDFIKNLPKQTSSGYKNLDALKKDIVEFLTTDCKNMTISDIEVKINEFKNAPVIDSNTTLRITLLGNFLDLFKKDVNNATFKKFYKDQEYVENRVTKSKLNGKYEYVKFLKYLMEKDDNFLKSKKLEGYKDKTLAEIEQHYGYTQ